MGTQFFFNGAVPKIISLKNIYNLFQLASRSREGFWTVFWKRSDINFMHFARQEMLDLNVGEGVKGKTIYARPSTPDKEQGRYSEIRYNDV